MKETTSLRTHCFYLLVSYAYQVEGWGGGGKEGRNEGKGTEGRRKRREGKRIGNGRNRINGNNGKG